MNYAKIHLEKQSLNNTISYLNKKIDFNISKQILIKSKKMKKLILVILVGSFSTIVIAQTNKNDIGKKVQVPDAVKSAFEKEFPGKKASWDAEDGGYEAEFKMNGTDASANYNANGHRTELEIEINTNELPAVAQDYIKKNYAVYKLTEAAKITNDKNVVTFEAEVEKDGKSWDVLFDANGKFIMEKK